MMSRRLMSIIRKEFRQIRRDKRVLAILTLVPAGLLLLNGYALNLDVQHITMGVYDEEKSATSRDFINSFVTSGYFDYVRMLSSSSEATALLAISLSFRGAAKRRTRNPGPSWEAPVVWAPGFRPTALRAVSGMTGGAAAS